MDGERETRVTFGFREGLHFGLGLAIPLIGVYLFIVLTLLYVIP